MATCLSLYQVNSQLKTMENEFMRKIEKHRALQQSTAKRRVFRTATGRASNHLPFLSARIKKRLRLARDIVFLKFRIADMYYCHERRLSSLYGFLLSERHEILMSKESHLDIRTSVLKKLRRRFADSSSTSSSDEDVPDFLQHDASAVPLLTFIPPEQIHKLKEAFIEALVEDASTAARRDIFVGSCEDLLMEISIGQSPPSSSAGSKGLPPALRRQPIMNKSISQ